MATTHLAIAGYLRLCGLNCYHLSSDSPLPPDIEERVLVTVHPKESSENAKKSTAVVWLAIDQITADKRTAEKTTDSLARDHLAREDPARDHLAREDPAREHPAREHPALNQMTGMGPSQVPGRPKVAVKIGGAEVPLVVKAEWVVRSSGSPIEDTLELLRAMEIEPGPVFFPDKDWQEALFGGATAVVTAVVTAGAEHGGSGSVVEDGGSSISESISSVKGGPVVCCCPLCGRTSLTACPLGGRMLVCEICPCVVNVDHLGYLRWRFSKK